MLKDENEDEVWRDYCIQFLTECYDSSNNKTLIEATMKEFAKGKDSKAGTAIVHLALQEANGSFKLNSNFGNDLVQKMVDPSVDMKTKTSILAVIGHRKDVSQIELIRMYAKQDNEANLKRTAIFALGEIGLKDDIPIIEAAMLHKNGAVKLAAKAALIKLQKN